MKNIYIKVNDIDFIISNDKTISRADFPSFFYFNEIEDVEELSLGGSGYLLSELETYKNEYLEAINKFKKLSAFI